MERFTASNGTTVSYTVHGSGRPLVLVHGAFSDHDTNWTFVKPLLTKDFAVYAMARRGRGATDATTGHSLEDEAHDVADVIRRIAEPVFLLGHSYGAHCALLAATQVPGRVRKLVLYEPARPDLLTAEDEAAMETLAAAGAWDRLAFSFFNENLKVPADELEALRSTEHWPPILADAAATLGDLRALRRYRFEANRFGDVNLPVLLQVGSESPRELYVTDSLAAVLPNVRIQTLPGQAHEGMTTAPEMYARMTTTFLLNGSSRTE